MIYYLISSFVKYNFTKVNKARNSLFDIVFFPAFGAVSPTTNPVITNGTFVTENNFASVFGSTENKGKY